LKETKASIAFIQNFERLIHLVNLILSGAETISATIDELVESASVEKEDFKKKFEQVKKTHREFSSGSGFILEWQAVMIVTFVETYLQDVLSEAAAIDPGLMKDSRLSATYDEVMSASSIEHLSLDLRRRWASRNFVDSGPRKWIERLRQMGAENLDPNLAEGMEQLWGIRHLIVHNAGIITQEFVRIHKVLNPVLGSRISLTTGQLRGYFAHVVSFITQTDKYLLKRFPGLAQEK
jgi:hypothetical protein